MTSTKRWRRRDVLRLGGMTGLAGAAASVGLARFSLAARAATAPLKVNIVNTASNSTMALQVLLQQQGFFDQVGLAPTTLNVADGSKLMGALFSGSSDICMLSGFSQVFPAIARGGKMKILAGAGLLLQDAIYSAKPDIHRVKDLEGRTVGTGSPGALLHQFTVALLRKKGVDVSKVKFVNVGSSAAVFNAVVAGTVDAGPSLIDVYPEQKKFGVHSLIDGDLWKELPEYTYQASYAADRAIEGKREALVRTLAAYGKLYRFISGPNSRDAFMKARQTALKKSDPIAAEFEWDFAQKYHPYDTDLTLSEERINYMQKLNIEFGIQKEVLPFSEVADMSLAKDALKLMG
ncbi:MAG TPA: ABC transporter substrate-binding protein [Stellaceae bacterium]|nr:ABC transporter substrate-binding protein [Stellaceae bacterium]